MKIGKFLLILCALAVPFTLSGCNTAKTDTEAPGEHADGDGHDHGEEAHSHEEGPHGGHLIELGDEKYHLEWDHDEESKAITFYVLDGDAKNEVAIPAESIQVNVNVEGADEPKTFNVPSVRKEGEATTAKFETTDADLFALIEDESVKAVVVLEIEGTPYEGEIEHHDHDH